VCHLGCARAERTLVAATLDSRFLAELPEHLMGNRAYDADPLDAALAELGVELIAPHRRGRTRPKAQDGRPLRRFRRRWKVERLFAWLGAFRRLVVQPKLLGLLGYNVSICRGRRSCIPLATAVVTIQADPE
jgi:transposase